MWLDAIPRSVPSTGFGLWDWFAFALSVAFLVAVLVVPNLMALSASRARGTTKQTPPAMAA